jgi:hypothetical protein
MSDLIAYQQAIIELQSLCATMGEVPDQISLVLCEDGDTVVAYAYFDDGRDTCDRPVYFQRPAAFSRRHYQAMFEEHIIAGSHATHH